jgi:WD40 repeat protein
MSGSLRGLQTVVLLDQHKRWTQGDRPTVEVYLQTLPELGSDPEQLLDVIYQEILLREAAGESPSVEEYVRRFPELQKDLRLQFEVHAGLPRHEECIGADNQWPANFAINGHRIEAELGRGTFGVVYKGWEEKLKRYVAVKLLRPTSDDSEVDDESSFREARSVARLVHPNIVQVYAVGQTDQGWYFSQEYVPDGTLTKLINGRAQPPRSAAAFVATLADAVHYAHLCSVIHCDLKPANILLRQKPGSNTASGEDALGDVEPKISDFGLALHAEADSLTAGNRLRGTIQYMAPEQTGDALLEIGPATDVYALGAILYELLTGRPPHADDSKLQVYLKVRGEAAADPRKLNPAVPADLSAICLKCLEKSPKRRYETAAALAEDLRRFLAGHVPAAVEASPWGRLARWTRRNPALAGLLAAVLLTTAIGAASVTAKVADARRIEASEQERAAAQYRNNFLLARRAWESGDVVAAQRILDQTSPAQRSFEWYYLDRQCAIAGRRLPWDGEFITSVTFDPTGRLLAIGDGRKCVAIVDRSTGQVIQRFSGGEQQLGAPTISPDGRLIAVAEYATGNSWIRIWDLATGEEVRRIGSLYGEARAIVFSANNEITSVSDLKLPGKHPLMIEVWDATSGQRVREARAEDPLDSDELSVAISPDGTSVALWVPAYWAVSPILGSPSADKATAQLGAKSSLDHKVLLIDGKSGASRKVLEGHTNFINGCVFNPQATRMVSVGADGNAMLWDVSTGEFIRTIQKADDQVYAAAFAPSGTTVATAGADLAVSLWDVETGAPLRRLGGHVSPIKYLAFAPDAESLASVELNQVIRISSLHRSLVKTLCDDANASNLAWVNDEKAVIYAEIAGRLRLCTLEDADGPGRDLGTALSVVVSADERWIGAIDKDGRLLLGKAREPFVLEPVDDVPMLSLECQRALAFSHDGTRLAGIEAGNRRAFILDVATRRVTVSLPTSESKLTCVAWQADDRLLAIGNEASKIALHDPRTGQVVKTLATQFPVRNIAFRPHSSELAGIGSVERFVEIWDTLTGNSRLVIPGYQSQTDDLIYTPDGKRLITSGPRKSVTIWDAESGDELLVLDTKRELPFCLAINSSGRTLAAVVGFPPHRKILVWEGSSDRPR